MAVYNVILVLAHLLV